MTPRNNDAGAAELEKVAEEAKGLFRRALDDVKKGSTYKQLGFGAATGWVTGYLGMKVGKIAALTLGGTLLVMQVASHKGYVKVNWNRVNKDIQKVGEIVEDTAKNATPGVVAETKRFVSENKYVAVGFAGGFLIGFSCS